MLYIIYCTLEGSNYLYLNHFPDWSLFRNYLQNNLSIKSVLRGYKNSCNQHKTSFNVIETFVKIIRVHITIIINLSQYSFIF